jgi:phosphoglycolate phosphatase
MTLKIVIFDYDGVIVDSFPSVHKTYQIICSKLNKECPKNIVDFKKIYGYVAKELRANLKFSEEDTKLANEMYLKTIVKMNPPLFPGIKQTIEKLNEDYKLILVSSSPREEVMSKLKKNNLDKFFTSIFAGDKAEPMRKVESLKKILALPNYSADEIVMIGDRNVDYDEGIKAGIPKENIILVEYGWGYDKGALKEYKQKIVVNNPLDLLDAIKSIKNRSK